MAPPKRDNRVTSLIARIGSRRISLSQICEDLLFLLDQLGTIEHAQDRERLEDVRKRYGWAR